MKVYIDRRRKVAGVLTRDVVTAGHVGFNFARKNPDVVEEGWILYYYDDEEELRRSADGVPVIEMNSLTEALADVIRNVCPTCGQRRPA